MAMRVSFITSVDEQCGIAIYSHELADELRSHIRLDIVPYDTEFPISSNLTHIQFQYPFFGGLAPHKTQFPAFLKKTSRPNIVTLHEIDLSGKPLIRFLKHWFNRRLFNTDLIEHFIVHTHSMKEQLVSLHISPLKITVIPMWAPKVEKSLNSTLEAKQSLGLDGNIVLGVFGFVVQRRGYDLLLDALDIIPPKVTLAIIGGPHRFDQTNYFELLKTRIAARPDRDHITITGYLSDSQLLQWMTAIDIAVAPFTDLAASASVLRCVAYEKPIIISDVPFAMELQERANCLSLFKTGSATSLRAKIDSLVQDIDYRKNLTQKAHAYAQSYTALQAAGQTLKIYDLVRSK